MLQFIIIIVFMGLLTLIYRENKPPINIADYKQFIVRGDYLKPRKINNDDLLLIKEIEPNKPIEAQINHDDLLSLCGTDDIINRVRIFDNYDENGLLVTYYYDDKGKRVDSPIHFHKSDAKGVVKYLMTDIKSI